MPLFGNENLINARNNLQVAPQGSKTKINFASSFFLHSQQIEAHQSIHECFHLKHPADYIRVSPIR